MKRELLKRDKNILKALNEMCDFDFQKEHKINKHIGKFTINSLVKEFGLDLYNDKIILLVHCDRWYSNKLFLVEVLDNKRIDTDFKPYRCKVENILDNFHTKQSFEYNRKNDNNYVYAISQNRDNLVKKDKIIDNDELNYNVRYKIKECDKDYFSWSNKYRYIIKLINTNNNEEHSYYGDSKNDNVNLVIDKSGYIVDIKKRELEERAEQLRTDRAKNKFLNTDYTDKLLKVDNMKNDIKTKLISFLNNRNFNYELLDTLQYNIVGSVKWLLNDIEHYIEKINEKLYKSVEVADDDYNKITNKYDKIIKVLV